MEAESEKEGVEILLWAVLGRLHMYCRYISSDKTELVDWEHVRSLLLSTLDHCKAVQSITDAHVQHCAEKLDSSN